MEFFHPSERQALGALIRSETAPAAAWFGVVGALLFREGRMRTALSIALAGALSLGCSGSIDGARGDDDEGSGATSSAGSGMVGSGGSAGTTGGKSPGSGGSAGSGQPGGGGNPGGGTSSQAGSGGNGVPADCAAAPDAGESVLRRLSNLEYQRTLQALFQLSAPPSLDGVPADSLKDGFELAATQTVSALTLRAYLDKATELADDLLADATRRSRVIGCDVDAAGCLDTFVSSFGKLAYRRPLEASEVKAITDGAATHATDAEDAFRYALEVLLTSPSFLFRVEIGAGADGVSTLTGSELAARLSFALTGRSPSAELLEQAAAGALDTPEGVGEVAAELLAEPSAREFYGAFFRRWLGYDTLRAPVPAPADWSDALLADMQGETDGLLDTLAFGGSNFLELLTTSSTRLTPELASYYGLPAPAADGSLTIPADDVRAGTGVLTHASLLSAKRDGDLIAIRGNWLRTSFLCEQIEPVDLTAVTEELVGLTRVEIVGIRNMRPDCNGCHGQIDPIGVGFGAFDATGRFDESADPSVYGIEPAVPDLENGGFASIAELAQKLAAEPRVAECLAKRAFLFVNARAPGAADSCAVAQAQSGFAAANHDFESLLTSLVTSPAFRVRRAPPAP
jgi:hypothetical protein